MYILDVLLSQFWTSPLFHVQHCCFLLHTGFSGGRSGGLAFHLFRNIPQFVVIHTVKGFKLVNKGEVDVFLESPRFFYDSVIVSNLISGSSAFFKSSLNICKFLVHVLLKPSLKDFEHNLASMWGVKSYGNWNILWHCLFLRLELKLTFSSPVALLCFLNLLAKWVQALQEHHFLGF